MCSGCLIMGSEWNILSVTCGNSYCDNIYLVSTSELISSILVHCEYPYVHHGLVGNRDKFPSCQCEFVVSCSNDEDQTALK